MVFKFWTTITIYLTILNCNNYNITHLKLANMSEVVSSSSSSSNAVEANRRNFNIDWRSKKPIFDEQMGYFYLKEEMADVEFVFDRQDKITVCQLLILSIFVLIFAIFRRFLPIHLHLLWPQKFSKKSSNMALNLKMGPKNLRKFCRFVFLNWNL